MAWWEAHGNVYVQWVWISRYQGLEGQSTAYQWNCSSLDAANNHYYLPNRNASVPAGGESPFDEHNFVYIFPVPLRPLNCSGTVSAIWYCYRSYRIDNVQKKIFELLILEQQNHTSFRINETVDIHSSPTGRICRRSRSIFQRIWYSCCDTTLLNHIPVENFAFGIADARPLQEYLGSEVLVDHYRLHHDTSEAIISSGNVNILPTTRLRFSFSVCK